jgi:integrase
MALYMGVRLEELGQALVSDVITLGGVLCLDINDQSDGKRVKTASSRRTIPIHPELLRLGFRRYVESLNKGGRLFPDLRQDQFGKWTGNFSKWWGRWAREQLGISDRRKVFHSFRHSFKAACRRGGIQEETHDLLTGHQGAGVGRSYGRAEYSPELVNTLAMAMRKITYPAAALASVKKWNR